MKKILLVLAIGVLTLSCASNKTTGKNQSVSDEKEIVILSVNDMHGHIEGMPRLASVTDSLRELYPNLLIFSAGDNRTGNSYNDFYPRHSCLPMINLMNKVGFDLSCVGNHEFDKRIAGLVYFQNKTKFPLVCANADFSKEPELKIKPYHFIDNQGVRICVLGLVETYNNGHPGTIKKGIKNISFTDPYETAKKYLYLSDSCDVFIILSHCSEMGDFPIADSLSGIDVIIGGHSHHKYIEYHGDSVLCTQALSYLDYADVIKIKVSGGEVISKSAEHISLDISLNKNAKIQKIVDKYYRNKKMTKLLGHTVVPLDNRYRIGCMLADTYRSVMKTDIAYHNFGAVRKKSLDGNEIKVVDVYDFSPFDNKLKTIEMTGSEIVSTIADFSTRDKGAFYVSGITYTIEYYKDKIGHPHYSNAKVRLENGEPIDLDKTYTVAMSEYPIEFIENGESRVIATGPYIYDATFEFFENVDTVGYQSFDRIVEIENDTLEVDILSVNDMHGHIENMPRFAFVVDSLREIYPELILVSAGDNKTGNVYNDRNPKHPNLPMITLMNELRFDVSEIGNHEFDGGLNTLKYFAESTRFPIICANADFSKYPRIKELIKPYVKVSRKIKDRDVNLIFLGMIETSNYGYPSTLRDSIKDVVFTDARQKIKEYLPLKDSCDVFVLLDHCGIEVDSILVRVYPEFDLIIGSHSHDLMAKRYPSGVLYTQSRKNLGYTTLTRIKLLDGKVVFKDSQYIDVNKVTKINDTIKKIVDDFCNVAEFNEVIGHSKTPLSSKEELGAFMVDAQRYLTKTDIAIQNPGGVRFARMNSTDFRVIDILNLDPFNNTLYTMKMSGRQVEEYLNNASTHDCAPCHVSGITYTIEHYIGDDNVNHFLNARAYLGNGEPIDHGTLYSVTLNGYIVAWAREMGIDAKTTNRGANEAEFKYLKDFELIDYQGVKRFSSTLIEK